MEVLVTSAAHQANELLLAVAVLLTAWQTRTSECGRTTA